MASHKNYFTVYLKVLYRGRFCTAPVCRQREYTRGPLFSILEIFQIFPDFLLSQNSLKIENIPETLSCMSLEIIFTLLLYTTSKQNNPGVHGPPLQTTALFHTDIVDDLLFSMICGHVCCYLLLL